jgi:hypothetical protein
VTFSGVACAVIFSNATMILCITRRCGDQQRGRVRAGQGSVSYLYIDRWSALTSWFNQEPPVDGDFVWVPDGQVILLDVNTPVLTVLLVEGSLSLLPSLWTRTTSSCWAGTWR